MIMKKITFFSLAILTLSMFSCEMADNTNPKLPSIVPAENLFANAERALGDNLFVPDVNTNISLLLSQYFSQTTYFGESRYNFMDRNIPDGFWANIYRDVLMDLNSAKEQIVATQGMEPALKANQLAAIDVLIVYSMQTLVDAFGNVPYSEACLGVLKPTPKYDDAKGIYLDILSRLNAAIVAFDVNSSTFNSASDIICGGKTSKWKAFAASLKLRIGIRLSDSDNALAKATVEAAAPLVINSAVLNVTLKYPGSTPYNHPWFTEFVTDARIANWAASELMINTLKSYPDPRIGKYYTVATTGANKGTFVGAPYGQSNPADNRFSSFAKSDLTYNASAQSVFIDFAEVEFLLAEAVERGYTVGGTAAGHYANAISASMNYWGCTSTEISNYLVLSNVDYATATGTWKQKIGTQKWLALYGRGVEAWAEWRRLDFPRLIPPTDLTYDDIPVRMPYPFQEDSYNLVNYTKAVADMGGVDGVNVKLFWDKY
jgi:hypothetical protein